MAENIENKVELLQKQVDQIQMKLLEDKKRKWYQNPALFISLIALSSSIIFSLITLFNTYNSQKEVSTKQQITVIKNSIDKMLSDEKRYNEAMSNQNIGQLGKDNAWNELNTTVSIFSQKVLKNEIYYHINEIEPNLLINYGRLLYMNSNYDLSLNIIHKTLEITSDSIVKSAGYKWLGRIYSDRNNSKFDTIASRKYRNLDVKIGRVQEGEKKYKFLSSSFEYWAQDEYQNIKNITVGNSLIDSARVYIKLISNYQEKEFVLNRLQSTFNFYNDVITSYNILGEYYLSSDDGKKGIAIISQSFNGYSIEYEHFENSKLILKLSGNGKFLNPNTLKFEVETEEHVENEMFADRSDGVLKLTTKKNKTLIGSLMQFNETPVEYMLVKK